MDARSGRFREPRRLAASLLLPPDLLLAALRDGRAFCFLHRVLDARRPPSENRARFVSTACRKEHVQIGESVASSQSSTRARSNARTAASASSAFCADVAMARSAMSSSRGSPSSDFRERVVRERITMRLSSRKAASSSATRTSTNEAVGARPCARSSTLMTWARSAPRADVPEQRRARDTSLEHDPLRPASASSNAASWASSRWRTAWSTQAARMGPIPGATSRACASAARASVVSSRRRSRRKARST